MCWSHSHSFELNPQHSFYFWAALLSISTPAGPVLSVLHLSYVTVELLDLTVIISPVSATTISGWLVRSSVVSKLLEGSSINTLNSYVAHICTTCAISSVLCYAFQCMFFQLASLTLLLYA